MDSEEIPPIHYPLSTEPIAGALGFRPLPQLYWLLILLTLLCYTFLTQSIKVWLLRRKWI